MQTVIVILLFLGVALTQVLMGGVKPLFAIPGYALIGVAGLLAVFFRKTQPGARRGPVLAAVALAGYIAVRAALSPVAFLARPDLLMVIACLVVYLLAAFCVTSQRQRLWLLYGLGALALLHVAGGFMQFLWRDNFMLLSKLPDGSPIPQLFRPNYGWRASGFYACPNHLAGLLEVLGMIFLALACFGRGAMFSRMVRVYLVVMFLACIAITGSRGGYLSTVGGLMVFAGLSLWIVKKVSSERLWVAFLAIGVMGVLAVGGVIYAMSQSALISDRLDTVGSISGNTRVQMWEAALKQFQLSPVVGTGAGTYLYYGRQFRAAEVQNDPMHAHNDYLELLSEYGIVGAGLMGVFIFTHLWSGWRVMGRIVRRRLRPAGRVFSNEMALLAGCLAAVAALLVHSIVDFNFHIPGNALFFAFLFGVLACPSTDPKVTEDAVPKGLGAAWIVTPVVAVALLVISLPLLRAEYHVEWARVHLRNQIFVEKLETLHEYTSAGLPSATAGLPMPAAGLELPWGSQYRTTVLYPKVLASADKALESERKNPDIFYLIGEGHHFMGLYSGDVAARKDHHKIAGVSYAAGLELFPRDSRLLLVSARTLDNLGAFDAAEEIFKEAFSAEPSRGDVFTHYGVHLLRAKKIARAEAYFRHALRFQGDHTLPRVGVEQITSLRERARNLKFNAEEGNPLDGYDQEPLTPEDEARGVKPMELSPVLNE